ncbi:hypothetical protein ACVR0S_09700 [Streptococcus dentapri]|uniref:Uncharacterized protein n=1 Tax=Streptococcus dentapri TaxID=573564 RepID=A0ABV8D1J2_9STRE
MLELKPEIIQALVDMNFVEQYEGLSDEYAADVIPPDERLRDIDVDTVIEIIENMGYKTSYDKKEKFFKIECKTNNKLGLQFNVHLVLRGGSVELIWDVEHNGIIELGPAIGYLPVLIDEKNSPIPLPAVLSYEELEEVLKINFDMFKQFQDLLIAHYEQEENQ